jgi:hypothetical protein
VENFRPKLTPEDVLAALSDAKVKIGPPLPDEPEWRTQKRLRSISDLVELARREAAEGES